MIFEDQLCKGFQDSFALLHAILEKGSLKVSFVRESLCNVSNILVFVVVCDEDGQKSSCNVWGVGGNGISNSSSTYFKVGDIELHIPIVTFNFQTYRSPKFPGITLY